MSPRPALRSTEKPLPRSRNWSPAWMPAGMFTRVRPPSTRRHLDLAAERRLGHPQRDAAKMFSLSRWKIGCASTEM